MTKYSRRLASQSSLINFFICVSLIILLHFLYHQYSLFDDVDVRQALFVFVELRGYISIGYLIVPIFTAVGDMVTYALEDIHSEYVSDETSIYPWICVTLVTHPVGILDTVIEV